MAGVLSSLLLLGAMKSFVTSAPTVSAPWGRVAGRDVTSFAGAAYRAYIGVPYALPPVGERRWQLPVAHPGLGGGRVLNVTKAMPRCPATSMDGSATKNKPGAVYSEDCLTLNVFTPDNDAGVKSVMVFIHGGGFTEGSADVYRPGPLVTGNDVIVVVIQYRLGILGFLATGDKSLPGNYGLWDQRLALQWVRDNIGAFGGDPNKVTIFGESAGAASVGYQLLSPTTRGLFSRAVMQSGVPLASWGFNPAPAQSFQKLVQGAGCKPAIAAADSLYYSFAGGRQEEEAARALACLRALDWNKLLTAYTPNKFESSSDATTPWVPVSDGNFLPRPPQELVDDLAYLERTGVLDVDTLLGVNNMEGGGFALGTLQVLGQGKDGGASPGPSPVLAVSRKSLEEELTLRVPDLLNQPDRLALLTDVIQFFYFGSDPGARPIKELEEVITDSIFVVPTVYFSRKLAEAREKFRIGAPRGSLYLYLFNHRPARRAGQELDGLFHAEDLQYQFDFPGAKDKDDDEVEEVDFDNLQVEARLGQIFTGFGANFAKTGDPQLVNGLTWPQFSLARQSYLDLSSNPIVAEQMFGKRVALWLDLVPELYNRTEPAETSAMWTWPWTQKQQTMIPPTMVPFTFRGTITLSRLGNH